MFHHRRPPQPGPPYSRNPITASASSTRHQFLLLPILLVTFSTTDAFALFGNRAETNRLNQITTQIEGDTRKIQGLRTLVIPLTLILLFTGAGLGSVRVVRSLNTPKK